MSMNGNLFGGPAERTKLENVRPGSEIEVRDREGAVPTFRAQVLETRPEYGPNSIPALILLKETGEQTIVTDTGKWDVVVLFDSSLVQQSTPPEHLIAVQQRPVAKTAIRFMGGPASAVEIIRWAGGRAVIQYLQGNGAEPDRLVVPSLEGVMTADIGDYVVHAGRGSFRPVRPEEFEGSYDVLNSTPEQAFQQEQAAQSADEAPKIAPLPNLAEMAGMSLQQQVASQPTPDRFPVGTPQPVDVRSTMYGSQPGPGVYERDQSALGNPLGIPQGGAHA
jgi:hypothetical protein